MSVAPPSRHGNLSYRPEVDGLRAVAVLPVVLYHMDIAAFGGGFVGVDVFFVISGYLITSIILGELRAGRFTIAGFYERRARRILPALFFVLLVCLPFAWILMLPADLVAFARSLSAVSVFASNIYFRRSIGYFAGDAGEKPLLHTWSLGVEEQFYIIFPLLLMMLWRLGKTRLAWALAAITLISFALSEIGWRRAPEATFFLLHTRAWELLIGSLLAIASLVRPVHERVGSAIREAGGAVGLLLILASVFLYTDSTPFPSAFALAPTIGTVLILGLAWQGTAVARMLSTRWAVMVGLISYSLYLWHQPLFAFARLGGAEPGSPVFPVLALASVALAYVSWRYVEKPFRDRQRFSRRQIFGFASLGSMVFLGAGLAGHRTDGFRDLKFASVSPQWQRALTEVGPSRRRTWQYVNAPEAVSAFAANGRRRLLILGDSHSKDLYNALFLTDSLRDALQVRRLELSPRCLSELHQPWRMVDRICADDLASVLRSELVSEADIILYSGRYRPDSPDAIATFARALGANGRKLVIVGNTAEFRNPLRSVLDALTTGADSQATQVKFAATRRNTVHAINLALRQAAEQSGLGFLDRASLGCSLTAPQCDLFSPTRELLYSDYGHWTLAGARFFGARMVERHWIAPLLAGSAAPAR